MAGEVLYTTRNKRHYKMVEFTKNRTGSDVLKYSIPKRNDAGHNFKSIPGYVFCAAHTDYKKGITINKQWLVNNFMEVDNAGGCNIKVLQAVLLKYK